MTKTTLKNRTVGHFHVDPILIQQTNAKEDLGNSIGRPVYLAANGKYYLAQANTEESANVVGVIWSFLGPHKFYLKCSTGPLIYRFPLPGYFFEPVFLGIDENTNTDIWSIDPNIPNIEVLPGEVGDMLWLSKDIPGEFVSQRPVQGLDPNPPQLVILGFKTHTGYMFRPKIIECLGS